MARYPQLAQRGLAIFVGQRQLHDVPRRPAPFATANSTTSASASSRSPDAWTPAGTAASRSCSASRYNLLGPFNDDASRKTATSTRHVALAHRNFGEFKVPSLRNVARTAPYMHDGSLATLRAVVRHYSNLDENRLHADGERILKPLDLDKYDVDALVAFLETLSPAKTAP